MVVLRFCGASIGGYRQGRCFDGLGMDTPPDANDAHVGKADTLEGFAASLTERLTRHRHSLAEIYPRPPMLEAALP
ncbi:hypothetical protein RSO01_47630 [Reyranella soli]|uniref:Uncharacterized protein n=1 Tax=Reyranella soli TaxID=1230389 RepID=A0A512NF73_9HYPH|nr:hypothetical protein RSO01_47630 [Reyranella soli]